MTEKDWEKWVRMIADEYDLDLGKTNKETLKQKKILEAAIHIFAEKGFSGSSTSEIAERAGVAEATIFKHYRTKKGLLLRLVIPAIAKVASPWITRSALKILEQDKPFRERVEDVILDRVLLIETNWKKIKIILVESLFHPELREAIQTHVAKSVFPVMSEKIKQLQAEGELRRDLPDYVLLRSVISMAIGYLLARNVFPEQLAQSEEKDEISMIAEVLLKGVGGSHGD
ncbi:TetR/AcrR family transcriptional regulator [Paenactinomyces guangxiensis]|uniref:TetR/AcrR family transcriptional regulator n=1 Tax=Paenactinomyces guangxiensis TaxID=1490290 RepID=A0A7W1WRN7_9BACL|nr:TetR/AcrR family transcriptional regulator [Paenactinomyces guangxiensis]MBA4494829.1 TetR/AcrR family transcriptional regulator [Paenactinomyces guangxiensis]MBH8591912.1 TetR/AcrR family transcriptional regulator [Paenactinomyces guangxiensis]